MIIDGLKTEDRYVSYGSRDDVCYFCANEYLKKYNEQPLVRPITRDMAINQLKGKIAGKAVLKLPFNGGPYIVCQKHMERFLNIIKGRNPEEEVEVEAPEGTK